MLPLAPRQKHDCQARRFKIPYRTELPAVFESFKIAVHLDIVAFLGDAGGRVGGEDELHPNRSSFIAPYKIKWGYRETCGYGRQRLAARNQPIGHLDSPLFRWNRSTEGLAQP